MIRPRIGAAHFGPPLALPAGVTYRLDPNAIYSVEGRTVTKPTATEVVVATLRERGIDIVRILWSDLHGVARGKDVTVDELPRFMESGVAFCQALLLTDLGAQAVESPDTSGAGWPDAIARPDLGHVRY